MTSNVHECPALDVSEGSVNFKNPACYVFPEENRCRPGDNFSTSKRARLEALLQRRPFEFAISSRQATANVLSITACLNSLESLPLPAVVATLSRIRIASVAMPGTSSSYSPAAARITGHEMEARLP